MFPYSFVEGSEVRLRLLNGIVEQTEGGLKWCRLLALVLLAWPPAPTLAGGIGLLFMGRIRGGVSLGMVGEVGEAFALKPGLDDSWLRLLF